MVHCSRTVNVNVASRASSQPIPEVRFNQQKYLSILTVTNSPYILGAGITPRQRRVSRSRLNRQNYCGRAILTQRASKLKARLRSLTMVSCRPVCRVNFSQGPVSILSSRDSIHQSPSQSSNQASVGLLSKVKGSIHKKTLSAYQMT